MARITGDLQKWRAAPQLTASKETGPQSKNCKQLASANNVNELEERPQASYEVTGLANTLISAL